MANVIYTFYFPDIGEGVVEGEVVGWLKQVGDVVKQDEPVVTVMTDKATVELPAPHPGVIIKHYYTVGQIAIKDKPLYDIKLERELPDDTLNLKNQQNISDSKEKSSFKADMATTTPRRGKVLATPKIRGIAKAIGVDISKLTGTGKDGRVLSEDLKGKHAGAEQPVAEISGDSVKPLVGIRGMMAKKMNQRNIPQFSYFEAVDVTRLIQLRLNFMDKALLEDIHLSYMPFFIRALSLTMRQYPILNSSLDMANSCIIYHKPHNIGIAIASPQGLLVPVLKDVNEMSMADIIHAYERLKKEVIGGKVPPEALKGTTISISNFGVLGGEGIWATPLINPPEVSILAIARIRKDAIVKNQEVVVRDVLPLSWSFDHRVIDGELAAMISHHYSTLLRDPAFLL